MKSILLIITSISLSTLFIYFFQKLFIQKNIIDKKNDRSSHNVRATRSGGLAMFCTLFIISSINYFNSVEIFDYSLIVPISLMLVVGLYDDIYKLDFKLKFIFQIIAAKIIIDNGLIIDNLHGVLGIYELNRIIAQLLTIFLVVAIINSINFIDGIDGLASTIFIIFIIGFEFFGNSVSPYFSLSIILVMSLLPLIYFNFRKKNKVFLGDSGSYLLGGVVSIYIIHILTENYIIKPQYDLHKIIFVVSILFYPIIDIVRVFFLRLLKGKSPFIADNNHIHHLILSRINSHFKTTLIIVFFSIITIFIVQVMNLIF
tara:strand:+ start:537 stop:1481 length:945 start_codon:yes stop_codon:yes gene_type:complete